MKTAIYYGLPTDFPLQVLVAKARSHTGHDLDLVLYPGTNKKTVTLDIRQLKPNKEYITNGGSKFTATANGDATIEVQLSGRTRLEILPAKDDGDVYDTMRLK